MEDKEEIEQRRAFEAAYAVLSKARYDATEDEDDWVKLIVEAFQKAAAFDVSTDLLSIVGSAFYAAKDGMTIDETSAPCSMGGSIMEAWARAAMMVSLANRIAELTGEDSLWATSDDALLVARIVKQHEVTTKRDDEKWKARRAERLAEIGRTLANQKHDGPGT